MPFLLRFVSRLTCLGLTLMCPALWADTVYETPEQFVQTAVPANSQAAVLWLDKPLQAQIAEQLGHPYPQARLRYWRAEGKSVWVLDEIGKEYPITAGFIVQNHAIARAQVLIYRETRGTEIHLPGFLQQFSGQQLSGNRLSQPVDAIAGATLSVNAMVKMAKVALLLDEKIQLPEQNKPSTHGPEVSPTP